MDLHPPTEVLVRNLASISSSSKILLEPATSSNSNSSIEGDISDADTNTSPLSSLCNSPCRMQVSIDDDDSDYNNNEGCKEVDVNAVSFDAIRYSWMKRIDDVAVSRESRKSRIRASRATWFTDEAVDNPDLKLPISITPEKGESSQKSNDVNEVSDEDRMDEKTSSDAKQGQNSFRYLNQKLQPLSYDDSCHSRNTDPLNDDLDNKLDKSSTNSRVRKRRIRYKYDTLEQTRTSAVENISTKIGSKFLNSKSSIKSSLQSQPAPCRLVIEETDIQCNNTNPSSAEEKDCAGENVEVFLSFQGDSPRAEAKHFIHSSNEDRLHDSFLSLHLIRQQLDPSLDEEVRSISGLIEEEEARDTLCTDEGMICSRANFDPQILANPFAIKSSDSYSNVLMNTMKQKVEVLDGGTPDISIDWGETFLFKESEEKKYIESTAHHDIISLAPKEPQKQSNTHKMSDFNELNIQPNEIVVSTSNYNPQNQKRSCSIFDAEKTGKIEMPCLLNAIPRDVFEPSALNGKIIKSNGNKTSDTSRDNSRTSLAEKCGSRTHKTTDQNNPQQNLKGFQCSSFPEDEACVGNMEQNEIQSELPIVVQEHIFFHDNAPETITLPSASGSDTCPLTENFITRRSINSSDETSSLDGVTKDAYPQTWPACHNLPDGRIMDTDVTKNGILNLSFPPYEITTVRCHDLHSFSQKSSINTPSQPKTYAEMAQDEPPALKILNGSLKNCSIDLVESRFPMDEISTPNLPVETETEVQYTQTKVSGEIIAETFELVQPSSPMAAFVASRCETSNHYSDTEVQSTGLSGSVNDSSTLAFTGKTKSSAENMLNELEDMMKDLEETFDEIETSAVENATSKNSDKGKKTIKEVPLLVISIDNDIGIPKGDIMLSLLSSNENESYDELMEDNVWPGKVNDAIWRCRTMRRNCDTKWLSSSVERDSPRHGQKRSIVVDVDDVRIVGGVDSIGETQASVIEYLNCDDFSDALVMYESILDIYNNYAVENECSERSIFQHKVYVATTLHNIGIIHLLNGNFQEAFTFFERATMIRASSLGVKHSDHITSLVKMALCMFSLGDFPGAHSNLEYAANLGKDNLDNLADLCQFAEILNNIACLAFMCGEMRTTADRLQQCRALLNVLAGNSLYMGSKYSCHTISLNASICEANLALLAFGERDIPTCVQGLEMAVKNQHLLLRDAHPTLLTTMEHLVAANVAGGQQIKALQLLRRMLHIQIDTFGTDHKSCAETCKKIVYLEKQVNQATDIYSNQDRTTVVAPSIKTFESFEKK